MGSTGGVRGALESWEAIAGPLEAQDARGGVGPAWQQVGSEFPGIAGGGQRGGVAPANRQQKRRIRCGEAAAPGDHLGRLGDRARSDGVHAARGDGRRGEGFYAGRVHRSRSLGFVDHDTEERCLALIGLDEMDMSGPDQGQDQARETGAAANVEPRPGSGGRMRRELRRIEKVPPPEVFEGARPH